MAKYFGTDGFRGRAGTVLTAGLAFRTGRFLGSGAAQPGKYLPGSGRDSGCMRRPGIVIGEDTRLSSSMLRAAFAAGAAASGADVYIMGVTTTPSVAFAARKKGFDYGVMISASHNPYYDNGIKIMDRAGAKLCDAETAGIEAFLGGGMPDPPWADGSCIGRIIDYPEGVKLYKQELISIAAAEGLIRPGLKIALDCACGAAAGIAPDIWRSLGAQIIVTGDQPDGININEGVGSTHIDSITALTAAAGCDIGFAYDGDADRCLASDEAGNPVNGDQLIYAAALDMKRRGALSKDTVAVTKMSNLGALRAFEREGIKYEITDVGDKYIWQCLSRKGLSLGGEQSGHIIFSDAATTGDGILTSLKIAAALMRAGVKASELFKGCRMYPQVLENVKVKDKDRAVSDEKVLGAVRHAEESLAGEGRILLRKSGTEPLVRVMAEAGSEEICRKVTGQIVDAMRAENLIAEEIN